VSWAGESLMEAVGRTGSALVLCESVKWEERGEGKEQERKAKNPQQLRAVRLGKLSRRDPTTSALVLRRS
jgi:hypothetical protein